MPKISNLDSVPGTLTGTEQLALNQNGVTYQAGLQDLPMLRYSDIEFNDDGENNANRPNGAIYVGTDGSFTVRSTNDNVALTVYDDGGDNYAINIANSNSTILTVESTQAYLESSLVNFKLYTPTGFDDAAGVVGAITWDEDYIYVKTIAG